MINRLVKKVRNALLYDAGDYRKTLFLAGTGRSGTTWLINMINAENDFRIMFEPFHSQKISKLKKWNYRQYLNPNDLDPSFLHSASGILSGKIKDEWIDRFNTTIFPKKRLIKDIRANLFLKWIKTNFQDIPIILIIRHPCAVANSKLKLDWQTHLNDFLLQKTLMKDYLQPFKSEIEKADSVFEKHIFLWCIENYVPLKQFNDGEMLVVFYESLCMQPKKELERIMAFIGLDFNKKMLEQHSIASALSRNKSAINVGDDVISSWRKSISECQIKRSCSILELFGLHKIYDDSDMPLIDGESALKIIL